MIAAVVFSRDRAMQLDLLLSSLAKHARKVFDPLHVFWRATDSEFRAAYELCAARHRSAWFVPDYDLAAQMRYLVPSLSPFTFLTDDSVLFRPLVGASPLQILEDHEDVVCFSFRLGRNTTYCYSMRHDQAVPEHEEVFGDVMLWNWAAADGDFGYPGSLDGHVFRGRTLRELLDDAAFTSPNELEDILVSRMALPGAPRMAAYAESRLVGIPANIVNTTHPNRHGEQYPYDIAELNRRYLAGERIALDELDFSDVRGAHQEIEFRFA
jgi:hypothetical protein